MEFPNTDPDYQAWRDAVWLLAGVQMSGDESIGSSGAVPTASPAAEGLPPYIGSVRWRATECEAIARDLLGSFDRWSHVQLVARNLRDFALSDAHSDRLVAAGWLHDIGYAPQLLDTGMHAVDGAAFLDRAGAPTEIVSLVAFHTGAEFEAEERGLLDRLLQFDRPRQEDLDVLILADLLSGPMGERVTVRERLDEIPTRYEAQHPVHQAIARSRKYLEECAARAAVRADYPM